MTSAICSQFVPLLLTHRQVELPFVVVLFGFFHSQFFLHSRITPAEKYTLKSLGVKCVLEIRHIHV
jgi:hypothetical protein